MNYRVIYPINHQHLLLENLAKLRTNFSHLSDVTLVTTMDCEEFPAHMFILDARSSVFADMFSELEESQRSRVEVPDISGKVMNDLLEYIYTGKVELIDGPLGGDYAGDLMITADKVTVCHYL